MRGAMTVKELGETTAVLMFDWVSVWGSKYCATTIELFCTSRRLKSRKKEAFLLIEPPKFADHIRLKNRAYFGERVAGIENSVRRR